MNAHRRVDQVCAYAPCGRTFRARAADLATGRAGRYCSRKCSSRAGWERRRITTRRVPHGGNPVAAT